MTRSGYALVIAAGTILAVVCCGCRQQKYPWGRDTVDSFGNGRFYIGRAPDRLVLSDWEDGIVVEHVTNWKARGGHVYVVDKQDRCWKVNYETGAQVLFASPDAAEPGDRDLFENLLQD